MNYLTLSKSQQTLRKPFSQSTYKHVGSKMIKPPNSKRQTVRINKKLSRPTQTMKSSKPVISQSLIKSVESISKKIAKNIQIKCVIKISNNGGNGKIPNSKMAKGNNNNNNNSIEFQFTLKEIQDIIKAALIDAVYECTLGTNITNLMKKPMQVLLKYFDMKSMYYIFHIKHEMNKINPKDITKKYFKNVFKKLLCNVNFELNKAILDIKLLN